MKSASLALAAAAAFVVTATACAGLKEAMSAHVDTAAKAGSQELSVDRLAKLLGEATVPPRKDVAQAIANAWVDYELLGQTAAKGDTVVTDKALDSALWAPISSLKAKKYYEMVSKDWGTPDTASARKMFENGDILAASHILILTKGEPADQKAAAKKKIDALRAQATSANFAALAKANSQDTPSAARGGSLGLFKKGAMVPQFEQALLALKPGEISPVIETEYGYHIIRRPTYDEVKDELLQASKGRSMQVAESTFVAKLQSDGKIDMEKDAATTARVVVADPDAHRNDKTHDCKLDSGQVHRRRAGTMDRDVPADATVAAAWTVAERAGFDRRDVRQEFHHQRSRSARRGQRQDRTDAGRDDPASQRVLPVARCGVDAARYRSQVACGQREDRSRSHQARLVSC